MATWEDGVVTAAVTVAQHSQIQLQPGDIGLQPGMHTIAAWDEWGCSLGPLMRYGTPVVRVPELGAAYAPRTLARQIVLVRAVFVSLIDERDLVLARNIRAACLQPPDAEAEAGAPTTGAVVAVIGMAHLAGVREALERSDI